MDFNDLKRIIGSNDADSLREALLVEGVDIANCSESGEFLINYAVELGFTESVEVLLEAGVDVNVVNSWVFGGRSPLEKAAKNGHVELLKILLEAGANIDLYGEDALGIAVYNDHPECAKVLVGAGVTVDVALISAARNGYAQLVEFFLYAGAMNDDTEAKKSALYVAAQSGHEDCMKLLINDGAEVLNNQYLGSSIFDQVVLGKHVGCMKLLLGKGIDVAKAVGENKGALEMAAQGGHTEIVKLILGTKVNLDDKISLACTKAVEGGHTEIVRLLLAEANDTVKGSAFREAAFNGNVECMQILLELGINDDAIAGAFNSVITSYKPIERIKLLLNLGLDSKVLDSYGRSPLDVAVEYGKEECVQLLAASQQANASSAGADAAAEHDFVAGSAELPQGLGAEDVFSLGEAGHSADHSAEGF